MDIRNIGQRISQLRKQSNMSQKELAEKLNISNKTISKWECGNGMPDIESLGKLANVFGITLDELVHFKAEPSPSVNPTPISSQEGIEAKPSRAMTSQKKSWLIALLITSGIIALITIIVLVCYFSFFQDKTETTRTNLLPQPPAQAPVIKSAGELDLDEENLVISYTVGYDVLQYSFNDEIQVGITDQWNLYQDVACTQIIQSKTVTLSAGNNVFYVCVENQAGKKTVYKAIIRRKPLYTATFNTQGGTSIAPVLVEEGELVPYKEPTRTGYIFNGWDYDFNKPITGNITINAKWKAKKITVVYYENDGSSTKSIQEITYGSQSTLFDKKTFTREGYTLQSWNTKADGSGTKYALGYTFNKFQASEDGLTLYAQWQVNQYSILATKNIQGAGQVYGDGSFDYGTTQKISAITNTGYKWLGWYSADGKQLIEPSQQWSLKVLACGQEYMAKWEAKKYTLTLDVNGGIPLADNTAQIEYDKRFTLSVPQRLGYSFEYWYMIEDGEEKIITDQFGNHHGYWEADEDCTLYAKWEIITYRIEYVLYGGELPKERPLGYTCESQEIVLLPPTKDGYRFTGWIGTDLSEKTLIVVIPAGSVGDRSYEATWEEITVE